MTTKINFRGETFELPKDFNVEEVKKQRRDQEEKAAEAPDTNTTAAMRSELRDMKFHSACRFYEKVIHYGDRDMIRWMARNDRFFLLTCVLAREDALHPWIYDRCREVERNPEGYLDLWSRFHYKSTIITLAGSIQRIIQNPNITIGIMANVSSLAKKFTQQIQRALEAKNLYNLFPEILHEKPPQRNWSAQEGIIVKRTANPKEPTVQPCGLVDGQPIGSHFALRIYDDIVTPEAVGTPDQIEKTTKAWELSLALGTSDGGEAWYLGTRYHPDDTYKAILDRGALKERRRICEDDNGRAVLLTQPALEKIRREMGERTYSAQMLQNPIASGVRLFKDDWLCYTNNPPPNNRMNIYIIVDSSTGRTKQSDFTVMTVIGLGRDNNYYLLDGIRERINLAQRQRHLFSLVQKWRPLTTFWEQNGLASDVEHIKSKQEDESYHFQIVPINQTVPKLARIGWLVPLFEQRRIWLPSTLPKVDPNGETYDFVADFVEKEYKAYPVVKNDDMLDCLANIEHPVCKMVMRFPVSTTSNHAPHDSPFQNVKDSQGASGTWQRQGSLWTPSWNR